MYGVSDGGRQAPSREKDLEPVHGTGGRSMSLIFNNSGEAVASPAKLWTQLDASGERESPGWIEQGVFR
jgi:hypothetical protein